ncbi:hypothetical protein [Legionella sp. W05-934-2]|uniref:acylneuraminate cytidylyltransferase family protein n=1 Tax=Legionella sp. W05-934-2 TaxID=1198649 RepID=UPI003462CA45
MSKPKILAIIPARGGSKRLPKKNIRLLNNKPLLAYTIEAAIQAPIISDVIVSSEDDAICRVAADYDVQIVKRPDALATDTVSNEFVVKHAIEQYLITNGYPEYIVLLQPTSPLRNANHIQQCLDNFLLSSAKSTLSVCVASHHPGKYLKLDPNYLTPYTTIDDIEKRTQLLEVVYRQNGAIYALRTNDFLTQLKFYQPPCLPYLMEVENSIDIDSQFDLNFCEFLLQHAKTSGEAIHAS